MQWSLCCKFCFRCWRHIHSCDLNNIELSSDTDAIELYVYDWSAGDYNAIKNNALAQFDWHLLFGYYFDADSLWEHFKLIVWPVIQFFVPCKRIIHNKKYRPRNYPKLICNLLSRKAAVWRQLRINKSNELVSKYRRIVNECKLEIHK